MAGFAESHTLTTASELTRALEQEEVGEGGDSPLWFSKFGPLRGGALGEHSLGIY